MGSNPAAPTNLHETGGLAIWPVFLAPSFDGDGGEFLAVIQEFGDTLDMVGQLDKALARPTS